MDIAKRRQNERKFGTWRESTVRFYQEVFDGDGRLREVHEKFPADLGHRKITGEES